MSNENGSKLESSVSKQTAAALTSLGFEQVLLACWCLLQDVFAAITDEPCMPDFHTPIYAINHVSILLHLTRTTLLD